MMSAPLPNACRTQTSPEMKRSSRPFSKRKIPPGSVSHANASRPNRNAVLDGSDLKLSRCVRVNSEGMVEAPFGVNFGTGDAMTVFVADLATQLCRCSLGSRGDASRRRNGKG